MLHCNICSRHEVLYPCRAFTISSLPFHNDCENTAPIPLQVDTLSMYIGEPAVAQVDVECVLMQFADLRPWQVSTYPASCLVRTVVKTS